MNSPFLFKLGHHRAVEQQEFHIICPERLGCELELVRPINCLLTGVAVLIGAIVEDKGSTTSVHYRLVADAEFEDLKSIFEEVVGPHIDSGAAGVTQGKKVFEIRPNVEWDKGKAALRIIETR